MRVVVVVGDSHAEHWLPALDSAGRVLGLKVVPHVRAGCPPWRIRFYHYYDGFEDTECEKHQERFAKILEEYGTVSLVLASSTGYADRMIGTLTPDQRAQSWGRGTANLLSTIPRQVKIILIEKTPHFRFEPVHCLARSAFWNMSSACDEDSATAAGEAAQYSQLEADAAAGDGRVRMFPTIDFLCSAGSCRALVGDTVVFRDEHHLTARYALSQTGRWMPYLRWAAGVDRAPTHPRL